MAEADGLLSVQWIPLDQLRPNPANPRRHGEAIQKVADSIQHFGWRQPIVVSKQDNMIEAGHARWEAAKRLGLQEVPVVFFDDDPVMAAAFNIADNRARDFSEWDNDALASLLVSLQSEDALLETGFTDADLDELLGTITEPAEETFDVAEALESGIEPRVQRGEVWQLGRHKLMCGDSTDSEDVRKLLQGQVPVLMATDPPYGVELDASWRREMAGQRSARGTRIEGDDNPDWEAAWHLWPARVAYVWHSSLHAHLVRRGLVSAGYEVRQQLIWRKRNMVLSRSHYHWVHECCWYAVRSGESANWKGGRDQVSVWDFASPLSAGGEDDEATAHPTQKPLGVFETPILNHTDYGEWVADPFVGSGTAVVAAERLSRRCLAMEIEPRYCEVSIQRWEDYTGQQAVKIG